MKKVLVTGAEGQLGKCIHKIAGNFPELECHFKDSTALDIRNAEEVNTVFKLSSFDYCINAAAFTNVEEAEKAPENAFLVNAVGVRNVAKAARKHGVILVHISTDYVFDGEKKGPYLASDMPNPINEYGKSKLAGEEEIQQHLTHYYIIRTSWLYSEYGHNFYKTILSKAKRGESLSVTDAEVGCPTNANHLAAHILELLTTPKDYGIYHFTDGMAMSWYQFAAAILKENDLEGKIELVKDSNYRTFARRPRNSTLK